MIQKLKTFYAYVAKEGNWCRVNRICGGVFISSLLLQLFVSNKTALKSVEIANLLEEKVKLEKQISALVLEDSELSSLTYIEDRAREAGFVNMSHVISVIPTTVDTSVAAAHIY